MRVTYYGTVADSQGNAPDPEPEIRLTIEADGIVFVDNVPLVRDGFSQISFQCPVGANITLSLDATAYQFVASAEEGVYHLADAAEIPLIRTAPIPVEDTAPVGPSPVSDACLWVSTPRILLVETVYANVPLLGG